jgi:hypothetical protein
MALTPDQRSAQRRLIGLVRVGSNGSLSREHGLGWWREETDGEWKSGHNDITEMFEALGIPYDVTIEKRPIRGRVRAVIGAYVAWDDLPAVVRWMPSFQQLIDQVEAGG